MYYAFSLSKLHCAIVHRGLVLDSEPWSKEFLIDWPRSVYITHLSLANCISIPLGTWFEEITRHLRSANVFAKSSGRVIGTSNVLYPNLPSKLRDHMNAGINASLWL